MPLERYDDMEPEKERRRRKRSTDIKVATIMILLFFIGLILLVIWSDGGPISPSDEEKGVNDASKEENGEIIHPTEENATERQDLRHLAVDDDGGYWVIGALLAPEEWRR